MPHPPHFRLLDYISVLCTHLFTCPLSLQPWKKRFDHRGRIEEEIRPSTDRMIQRTSLRVVYAHANIIYTNVWCLGRAAHSGIPHPPHFLLVECISVLCTQLFSCPLSLQRWKKRSHRGRIEEEKDRQLIEWDRSMEDQNWRRAGRNMHTYLHNVNEI